MANNTCLTSELDHIIDAGSNEISNRFNSNNLSVEAKDDLRITALETLPEAYFYTVEQFFGSDESKFSLHVLLKEFTEQNVEEWLQDFQDLNNVTLKIAAKKKATKGYLV